jgi:hypothetical protein
MTTYKLNIDHRTEQVMSVCKDDNYGIPFDSGNADYQEFLDWLNEGNTITDKEIPEHVLAEAVDKKFKQQLSKYAEAVVRLSQHVLSEGRAEIKQMIATGETVFNEETLEMDPVLMEVTTHASIEPVPLTVEVSEMNKATMEMVITTVDNPVVIKDLEERTAAQAIIAATPPDVVTAYENSLET